MLCTTKVESFAVCLCQTHFCEIWGCESVIPSEHKQLKMAAAARDVCEGSLQQVGKQLRKAAARQALRPNDLLGASVLPDPEVTAEGFSSDP